MQTDKSSLEADVVCYSHLRWNFVFQRPQHLMSRFARNRRVFFFEEPVSKRGSERELSLNVCPKTGVRVATPVLPEGLNPEETRAAVARLAETMFKTHGIDRHIAWFYTPMAIGYCPKFTPLATVYDCMDELSLFKEAPAALPLNEEELFRCCDLVFTGGVSLFEAKRRQHPRVYPFPSSVDVSHFQQARVLPDSMPEQAALPRPRLGYAGVIDERIDLGLIRGIAEKRPEWQLIMVGPVVKIDPSTLPRLPNIHWIGAKQYSELPGYLAGWDIALMPFALNEATRFISPTKTPEYLAAGLPVISTEIRDVVRQYGRLGMVHIGAGSSEFVAAADEIIHRGMCLKLRHRIDEYLGTLSWDRTWNAMDGLIREVVESKTGSAGTENRAMRAQASSQASQAGAHV